MKSSRVPLHPPIVGSSPEVEGLRKMVSKLALSPTCVLITGESGVGKELLARNLHSCSGREAGPFVAVNCAALNPGTMESELFGHGRGAFTGAFRSHAGFFEQADGGTLFLDEIGEMPFSMQAKLLRVLQEREVRRMGEASIRQVDIRVISSTNANLTEKIRAGQFRQDLYFRINVVEIRVPPLRERASDIQDLIEYFFRSRGLEPPRIPGETRDFLFQYPWPGNVRELENEVERLLALNGEVSIIAPGMLSPKILSHRRRDPFLSARYLSETPLSYAVGELEQDILRRTLVETNWNKSLAARKLGLSRQGLLKKIKRYGIERSTSATERSAGEE